MPDKIEVPVVLGTAGHIDHGKTTLVRALTGIDCDRLSDEKRRGITIELGFAPLSLPGGRVVSIIDVPGHERFIRQMVAGAAGIDGVIFVVAADEGVRAQTREHLEILGLIGVRHGLIVMTKSDLVEADLLELAAEEVREEVRGTFLEGSEIIPVSSVSGKNLDMLAEALERLVERIPERSPEGAFFMPIDRAFPVKGFGSVVTGTAYRGRVRKDDTLLLLPGSLKTEIRSVQVHDKPVEEARSGQRVALSLGGISLADLERGYVLCTPGVFSPSSRMDVRLAVLPSSPEPLHHWQRVRIHIGTTDVVGRVSFLDRNRLDQGDECNAQLVTEEPVVAVRGEAFIIRFYSPLRTIGGGAVLMPFSGRPRGKRGRKARADLLSTLSGSENLAELFSTISGFMPVLNIEEMARLLQELPEKVAEAARSLDMEGNVLFVESGGGVILNRQLVESRLDEARQILKKFHEEEPENPGIPADILARRLFPEVEFRYGKKVLERWAGEKKVEMDDQRVRLPDFSPGDVSTGNPSAKAILDLCERRLFQLPGIEDISSATGISSEETARHVEALKARGQIFLAAGGLVVSRSVLDRFVMILETIQGDITVASVRDATGSSRKNVLPMLEMLDSMGVTRRVQEKRIIRKK